MEFFHHKCREKEVLGDWKIHFEEDAGEIDEFLIYPNPTFGHLFVRINRSWEPPFQVEMHNLSGHLIKQETFESHSQYFDLHTIPSGVYLLRFTIGSEQFTKKVIVSR